MGEQTVHRLSEPVRNTYATTKSSTSGDRNRMRRACLMLVGLWTGATYAMAEEWIDCQREKYLKLYSASARATWKGPDAPNNPRMKLLRAIASSKDRNWAGYHLSEIGAPPYVSGF